MERFFENAVAVANLLYKRSQRVEGPEESVSRPAPAPQPESLKLPVQSPIRQISERSSEVDAAMKRAGYK
jgi:hypothetical protein